MLLCALASAGALAQSSNQNPPNNTQVNQPDSASQPPPGSPTGGNQALQPAHAPDAQLAPPILDDGPGGMRPNRPSVVRVAQDPGGFRLNVDGRDFMVYGMNWDYIPIGKNYSWSLWSQPDEVIVEALAKEMPLLKRMGVNAIRQYAGIPAKWVTYIYQKWGIYTVLNPIVGRYGSTIDGVWYPSVDYADPKMRKYLTDEVLALVAQYKETPGLLMWLLGNENNYGLHWASSEIEALPEGKRDEARARFLYSLMGEIIRSVKERDKNHPVAIANGDAQYIDLIAQECKGLDIFGTNVYRGLSAGDLFRVVHDTLGVPMMFTEFGSDAFNAKLGKEDDVMQARYVHAQWREIYEQSAGKGGVGNAIGGFVFQWSDGWWKFGQTTNLDVHDTNASWPDAAYAEDFVPGANNMNEEWWGICAKGQPDDRGIFDEYPRTAYYVLQADWKLDPYGRDTNLARIRSHFAEQEPEALSSIYRADRASRMASELSVVRISGLRASFETYSTGSRDAVDPSRSAALGPGNKGFDHMESFYADIQSHPTERVTANLSLNVLGNVAQNPIDQIFYENRGRAVLVNPTTGQTSLTNVERVKVYGSSATWDDDYFNLLAYYRVGHYHWGYEGDFFGLYREANYGPSIDTYNADVPLGMEIDGKRALSDFKVAFGPQIWWGANPQIMVKYQHNFGSLSTAAIYEDEVNQQSVDTASAITSNAIPTHPTRKVTVYAGKHFGILGLEAGGIWAGSSRHGAAFQYANDAQTALLTDTIQTQDEFGGKLKVTAESGNLHWYAQGAYMGLVANGGPTSTLTFTGWTLGDSGSGNQTNAMTGLAYNFGSFQLGPNFLWQKPLIGPVSPDLGRPRDVLPTNLGGHDDPFAVRANREMVATELMIVYDPTPETWFWTWDSDLREDAPFAASLDFSYKHQPTTQDSGVGFLATGQPFVFGGAPPPHDLVEARLRVVSALSGNTRIIGHAWAGTAESTGSDGRLITRFGADLRLAYRSLVVSGFAKVNDWGPYDYHRDFNLTFPLQLMGDVSYVLATPRWLGLAQTRFGVRGTLRYLDRYSPRFVANPNDIGESGNEYEIRTYLNFSL